MGTLSSCVFVVCTAFVRARCAGDRRLFVVACTPPSFCVPTSRHWRLPVNGPNSGSRLIPNPLPGSPLRGQKQRFSLLTFVDYLIVTTFSAKYMTPLPNRIASFFFRSAVWAVHDCRRGWRVVHGQHRGGHCRRHRGQGVHRWPAQELGLLLHGKFRRVRPISRMCHCCVGNWCVHKYHHLVLMLYRSPIRVRGGDTILFVWRTCRSSAHSAAAAAEILHVIASYETGRGFCRYARVANMPCLLSVIVSLLQVALAGILGGAGRSGG